jgi:hypothetical protein
MTRYFPGSLRCPHCKVRIKKTRLQRHLRKVHAIADTDSTRRVCFRCGQFFTPHQPGIYYCSDRCRLHSSQIHATSHPGKNAVQSAATVASAPLQQCKYCGCWIVDGGMPRHLKRSCPDVASSRASRPTLTDASTEFRDLPTVQLPFRLLPPGTWDVTQVIKHYQTEAQAWLGSRQIQAHRLHELKTLQPSKCYVGTELWLGYILFEFAWSTGVVLECPIEGNATYILSGPWQQMLRRTKAYLRTRFASDCTKVVHKGDWLVRVWETLDQNATTRQRPRRQRAAKSGTTGQPNLVPAKPAGTRR